MSMTNLENSFSNNACFSRYEEMIEEQKYATLANQKCQTICVITDFEKISIQEV